jgi:hypothetical protein
MEKLYTKTGALSENAPGDRIEYSEGCFANGWEWLDDDTDDYYDKRNHCLTYFPHDVDLAAGIESAAKLIGFPAPHAAVGIVRYRIRFPSFILCVEKKNPTLKGLMIFMNTLKPQVARLPVRDFYFKMIYPEKVPPVDDPHNWRETGCGLDTKNGLRTPWPGASLTPTAMLQLQDASSLVPQDTSRCFNCTLFKDENKRLREDFKHWPSRGEFDEMQEDNKKLRTELEEARKCCALRIEELE